MSATEKQIYHTILLHKIMYMYKHYMATVLIELFI